MYSYRHGFHAGNHADVLKHMVLVQLIAALIRKDKPLYFIDTHAGAGAYALTSGFAAKSTEYQTGIGKLWGQTFTQPALTDYLDEVRSFNAMAAGVAESATAAPLTRYPGSPQLAWQMMRDSDRLRLFEAHSSEIDVLNAYFSPTGPLANPPGSADSGSGNADQRGGPDELPGNDRPPRRNSAIARRVGINAGDGFAGLKAVVPPPSRRGLILIDPSYEDKFDYRHVITALREGLQRFATGTYAIWYPQVQRRESQRLPEQLQRMAGKDWLHVSLTVKAPNRDGLGLNGSGMFIFNPPWKLEAVIAEAMPILVRQLGQDEYADYQLDYRQS